ncbi:APC family permease [Gaiella sp.]|uniref:APC family permease n=1 Tax=Gaiella sp. TaxID=2663207 RepID=UPI0039C8B627
MAPAPGEGELRRQLGAVDATVIGVGSMVGAGVFSAIGPAAAAAGSWLLLGLALAAIVACCNAFASAQLAAQYPVSGGTYFYGRERLGPWWGFAAGWCFVTGKTASCAAMAVTFGAYVLPDSAIGRRALGIAAVVALTAVTARGITRTAHVTRVLVAVSIGALAFTVVTLFVRGEPDVDRLGGSAFGAYGVLQSAGLLFFSFAGYARIATLGEEVREPARTIPRAIVAALGVALGLYVAVALGALLVAGPDAIAGSAAPLRTAVELAGASFAKPIVTVGAAVASLGALLALLSGVGRTTLAMARNRDLPGRLAAVDPGHGVPRTAQLAIAALVAVAVAVTDLRGMIGFSSFGVLLYYAIANAAAWTQDAERRRTPRALQAVGLTGCLALVVTLPLASVVVGACVLAAGLLARLTVGPRGARPRYGLSRR